MITSIHTVASLGGGYGGPSRTVPALCRTLQQQGVIAEIVTTCGGPFGELVEETGVPVFSLPYGSSATAFAKLIHSRFAAARSASVVLHDHGQWLSINRASARVARSMAVKRIVTPRGMLSPWAMGHHRWKKLPAWWLYARRDLANAAVIHATSDLEKQELRDLGVVNRIATIPNGVDVDGAWDVNFSGDSVTDKKTQEYQQRSRNVLFMSRIHIKKGVQELVTVWRQCRFAGWDLVLAGPDESRLIDGLKLDPMDRIRYVGEVTGSAKATLLRDAEIFILPSHSENFGVVVAEALMAGTPVITTRGTPWEGLHTQGCGWWIEMTQDAIAQALTTATGLSDQQRAAMGNLGREWVKSEFTWTAIANAMRQVYEYAVLAGPTPRCMNP